ncbi:MAG: alpha/beta hydrolase fold containing protein [Chitinophagaceae bacterium]|nr:alpha/beta hydrolase fold containing protein [Chitinophagaceae bacterium]
MKLFFREMGHGPDLIILHGLFGSSDNWLSQAKILANEYHVILPDARNHGQSPFSAEHNYTVMCEDLMELITSLHLSHPFIIGHSMGGKTLMKFLELYPTIVAKAVVADISPRYYTKHHDHILNGLAHIPVDTLESRQAADQILSQYLPELSERQFLLKNLYRNEEGHFKWRINLPVLTQEIENIGEGLSDQLSIDTPVLFLHGGSSNYVTERDLPLISKIFKHYQIKTIEGVGHWLHSEKPQEFIRDVDTFFKSDI